MRLVDFVIPVFNLYFPGILNDAPSFLAKCVPFHQKQLKLSWLAHFKPAQVYDHSVVPISNTRCLLHFGCEKSPRGSSI